MTKTAYTIRNKVTKDLLLHAEYNTSGELHSYFGSEGVVLDTTSFDMQNYLNNLKDPDRPNSLFVKNDTYSMPIHDKEAKQIYISQLELVKVKYKIEAYDA